MATRSKLGAAGATILNRRTGGEALAVATAPTEAAPAGRRAPRLEGYKVTTIRFTESQWTWLRRLALDRSIASGTKADASEIVRELVAAAMQKGTSR